MPYKDLVKRQEYYENNKERIIKIQKERYEKNKEKINEITKKRVEDRKQNARDSITSGEIINQHKWDMWCNQIKRSASSKHPYSEDFTNDAMFEMMCQGCFYCGDIATGIDRIDSTLSHTPENCVGSCKGCNYSKGSADSATFIRKAYYRARKRYYDDDTNIWFVHKNKPTWSGYKIHAEKKEVPFDLSKKDFDVLIKGDCAYCHRSPETWFGIDRMIPTLGYVLENVVSCCCDCNTDKFEGDVDTMIARNERIAVRVDIGELVIENSEKVILHRGKNKTSRKVCAYGDVYASKTGASRALLKSNRYIGICIENDTNIDDIFEITDEFYEEYNGSDLYITKNMFIAFDHFYTNIM